MSGFILDLSLDEAASAACEAEIRRRRFAHVFDSPGDTHSRLRSNFVRAIHVTPEAEAFAALDGTLSVSNRELAFEDIEFDTTNEPDPGRHFAYMHNVRGELVPISDCDLLDMTEDLTPTKWVEPASVQGTVPDWTREHREILGARACYERAGEAATLAERNSWLGKAASLWPEAYGTEHTPIRYITVGDPVDRVAPKAMLECEAQTARQWSDVWALRGVFFAECTIVDDRLVRAAFDCTVPVADPITGEPVPCGSRWKFYGAARNHVMNKHLLPAFHYAHDKVVDGKYVTASERPLHRRRPDGSTELDKAVTEAWVEAKPVDGVVTRDHVEKAMRFGRGRLKMGERETPYISLSDVMHNAALAKEAYVVPKSGGRIMHRYTIVYRTMLGHRFERNERADGTFDSKQKGMTWEHHGYKVFDESNNPLFAFHDAVEYAERFGYALQSESMNEAQWVFVPGQPTPYDPHVLAQMVGGADGEEVSE